MLLLLLVTVWYDMWMDRCRISIINSSDGRNVISRLFRQYHVCWCPGSFSRHDIKIIWQAICKVVRFWIWSSAVEQNPIYDTKCDTSFIIFKTIQHVKSWYWSHLEICALCQSWDRPWDLTHDKRGLFWFDFPLLDQSYQSITQTCHRQAHFNYGCHTDQIWILHEFRLHHYFWTTHQIVNDSM